VSADFFTVPTVRFQFLCVSGRRNRRVNRFHGKAHHSNCCETVIASLERTLCGCCAVRRST